MLEKLLNSHNPEGYESYKVVNLGKTGYAVNNDSDAPYTNSSSWDYLFKWRNAEYVIIILGTNDARQGNWITKQSFIDSYSSMINTIRNFPSKPKIFVSSPPPVFLSSETFNSTIVNHILPEIVYKISTTLEGISGYIDLFGSVFGGLPLQESIREIFIDSDGVHPNREGMRLIARKVSESILGVVKSSPSPTESPFKYLSRSDTQLTLKVGIVGDSIAGGFGLRKPYMTYPSRLQTLADQSHYGIFKIQSFCGSNVTISTSVGNNSFVNNEHWNRLVRYNPDIIIVQLGTQDTNNINWRGDRMFISDYSKFVDNLRNEIGNGSSPSVILTIPPPVFADGGLFSLNKTRYNNIISDLINSVSSEVAALTVIDFFTLFGGKELPDASLKFNYQKDGTHPSRIGTRMMAVRTMEHLTNLSKQSSEG